MVDCPGLASVEMSDGGSGLHDYTLITSALRGAHKGIVPVVQPLVELGCACDAYAAEPGHGYHNPDHCYVPSRSILCVMWPYTR
jgi:hypothetical protein